MNDFSLGVLKDLRLNLGIEGSEVTVEPIVEEVVEESDSTSAQAIDTVGDIAEVDEMDATADDLQNVVEDGDELVAAMESAVANKVGLSPIESTALKSVVKQLTKKYSPIPVETFPAREEFGGTADAVETTTLALEGLKESFATFWEVSKKQFLNVIEAIQKVFRSIIQYFTSTRKRAESLRARLDEGPIDAESTELTVKIKKADITTGGEDVGSDLVEGLKNIVNLTDALLKNTRGVDDRAEVNKGVDALKDANVWSDYVNAINSKARRTFDAIPHRSEDSTTMLPGLVCVTFSEGQPNTRDQFSYEALQRFNDSKKDAEEVEVPVLNAARLKVVCDAVIMIADQIAQYDKVWNRSSSKAARLVQGINSAAKGDAREEAEENEETKSRTATFKINVTAILNHVRRLDKFSSELVAYSQATANTALLYGERSIEAIRSNTASKEQG